MNTFDSRDSRALLILAWLSVLIGSTLPELVLGFRHPANPMHWLWVCKAAFLIAVLVLTFLVRTFISLRALLIILLVLHVTTGAFGSIVSSAFWRQQVGGIKSQFIRAMIDVQFVRVGVTLIVLAVLFALFRVPSRFYFARGKMSAKASRVAWLGISGSGSWNRVGSALTVILSLGTLTFLSIAMRPALFALPNLISMLPVVLVFSITNAIGEEVTYRLALLAPTANLAAPGHAMMMSAAYFGLAHYYGIPSGFVGVVMAGFLGWLACRSVLDTKGVAWAFIMHLVQDIWIFWFMAAMFSLNAK